MIQPNPPNRSQLLDRFRRNLKEHRELIEQIRQLPQSEAVSEPDLREQRHEAWKALRGTITYYGDIVAPLSVEWDAAQ
jgi:hypothetical protein